MLIRYLTANFPAPKPGVGDPVMRSQFVTGWLPESRPHFAALNNGEISFPTELANGFNATLLTRERETPRRKGAKKKSAGFVSWRLCAWRWIEI
jgi:hypothetical protein